MNPENGGIENGSVGGIDRDSADRRMVFLAGYQQWPGMDVPIPFGRNTAVAEFGRRAGEKSTPVGGCGLATICVTIVKWLFLLAIRLTEDSEQWYR